MKSIFLLLLCISIFSAEPEALKLPKIVNVLQIITEYDKNGNWVKYSQIVKMSLKEYIRRNHVPIMEDLEVYKKDGHLIEIIKNDVL